MKIDCSKNCKMSKELRKSSYCSQEAVVVDSKIHYSCKEAIKTEPKEVRQFYSCDLWNLDLKESCKTCKLECINNKNEEIKEVLEEKKKLDSVIDKLRPNMMLYGVSSDQVNNISSKYAEKNSKGKRDPSGVEAIKAANFANEALKGIMSGKMIDVAFLTLYARKTSGRLKKMRRIRKKRSN
jgi:hypothetical protein